MEKLKDIKCSLVNAAQEQLKDLKKVDAKELGEVVDMIKDLEEAMYYCSIIQAMEESKQKASEKYYTPYMEYAPYMMEAHYRKNMDDDDNMHRSYMSRRMYMENKYNADHSKATKELEHFFSDLATEINEMIEGSSLEDKQLLVTKLTWLANKITNSTAR